MAIVQNTLIGRTRQSVGGTTFSKWKGSNVLRSKASSVKNPKTDGQVSNRAQMTGIVAYARAILFFIQLGLNEVSKNMSQYNSFVKFNKGLIDFSTGVITAGRETEIVATKGSLEPLKNFVCSAAMTTGLQIEWDTIGYNPLTSMTDTILCYVYNKNTQELTGYITAATRANGTINITKTFNSGDELVVFGGVTKVGNTKQSDSKFVEITVA